MRELYAWLPLHRRRGSDAAILAASVRLPTLPRSSQRSCCLRVPGHHLLHQPIHRRAKEAALGVNFAADPNTGPTSAQALQRTFGQPLSAVRVKLYRDHASWCPYCQKASAPDAANAFGEQAPRYQP